MKCYIIRHGNTFEKDQILRRAGARTDLDLTAYGRQQIFDLAEKIAHHPTPPEYLLCGPLKRTQQAAGILQARLKLTPAIQVTPLLLELDYGIDENQEESLVRARLGQRLSDWEHGGPLPWEWQASDQELHERWKNLLTLVASKNRPVALITSAGIARYALRSQGLHHPSEKLAPAHYGILELRSDQKWHIECWNQA